MNNTDNWNKEQVNKQINKGEIKMNNKLSKEKVELFLTQEQMGMDNELDEQSIKGYAIGHCIMYFNDLWLNNGKIDYNQIVSDYSEYSNNREEYLNSLDFINNLREHIDTI